MALCSWASQENLESFEGEMCSFVTSLCWPLCESILSPYKHLFTSCPAKEVDVSVTVNWDCQAVSLA